MTQISKMLQVELVQELALDDFSADSIVASALLEFIMLCIMLIPLGVPDFKLYHLLILWSFFVISLHSNRDVSILMEMMNSVGRFRNEVKAFEAKHAWFIVLNGIRSNKTINLF